MNNLEVRESQCKRDIEKLQQELEQIQKEKECQPKWKHGDRFINTGYCLDYSKVRVLINIHDRWYLTSKNEYITDKIAGVIFASGTYEACRNYIDLRLSGQHCDEYKYIDNIFEGKY